MFKKLNCQSSFMSNWNQSVGLRYLFMWQPTCFKLNGDLAISIIIYKGTHGNAFKISSFCYIRVCFHSFSYLYEEYFSLWSSSYDLRGNYILSLSKPKTTTYGLKSFSYFQLSSGMHCRTFFVLVFLQTLRPKYRMLPSYRFFLPDILKLKTVNCT